MAESCPGFGYVHVTRGLLAKTSRRNTQVLRFAAESFFVSNSVSFALRVPTGRFPCPWCTQHPSSRIAVLLKPLRFGNPL